MDNNNFEKEQQNLNEESEKQTVETQPAEEAVSNSQYYDNGPRLPRSETRANAPKVKSVVSNKDKLSVIIAMGALALVLISVVMLITFCGGASGHKHEYTYTLDKVGESFVLRGKCTVDGCVTPDFTDKNLQNVTLTEEIEATCLVGGKKVYSYEKNGVAYVYEEITGDAKSHTINGVNIDDLRNEDGALTYMPPYVTLFAGDEVTCGLLTDGSYRCSVCGDVGSSKVYVDHASDGVWKQDLNKAPSCTEAGIEVLTCKYCDEQLEKREAAAYGHKYSSSLNEVAGKNDRFTLITKCLDGKCTYFKEEVVYKKDMDIKVEEANCARPTTEICGYTTFYGEFVWINIETGKAVGEHMLDGKPISSYDPDRDGEFEYGVSASIKLSGSSGKECGKICTGYFECESCEGVVRVDIKLPAHRCASQPVVIENPTASKHGKATATCGNSWCKESEVVFLLDLVNEGNTSKNPDGTYNYSTKIGSYIVTIEKLKVAGE